MKKSLYGLKQVSRQWFTKLHTAFAAQGFTQSKNDYSLFLKNLNSHLTIVAVYVDDIIVTGSNSSEIDNLKSFLHQEFTIKDLGFLHYFLGLEVHYLDSGIVIPQRKSTQELLQEVGFLDVTPCVTPLP